MPVTRRAGQEEVTDPLRPIHTEDSYPRGAGIWSVLDLARSHCLTIICPRCHFHSPFKHSASVGTWERQSSRVQLITDVRWHQNTPQLALNPFDLLMSKIRTWETPPRCEIKIYCQLNLLPHATHELQMNRCVYASNSKTCHFTASRRTSRASSPPLFSSLTSSHWGQS